jgi:gliding motility-associated-like protein
MSAIPLHATHNLAGQITAEQSDPLNPNTYRIILTTYTDPEPAGVDRCSADFEIWSTGSNRSKLITLENIARANGPLMTNPPNDCDATNPRNGIVVKGTVKRNIYIAEWTFPGPGEYDIYYYDIARHGSVVNIRNPEEQAFFVATRLFITPPIIGDNNTLLLLNEPLDDACAGKLWTHNPGGFDADGDSLVYSLEPSYHYDPSQSSLPQIASNYQWPDDPDFGNSTFVMDSITGLITWDVPSQIGIYNFGYKVEEYRNGRLLGYVIRDMAIWVIDCDNDPPVIESIKDTCVAAGETLIFDYLAYDPNEGDSLYLELNNGGLGNNGPFSVANPATIEGMVIDPRPGFSFAYANLPQSTLNNGIPPVDTITGTITWETTCDNIRKQFYQVDFYATDNKNYALPSSSNTTLAANHIVTIRVIPPAPDTLILEKGNRTIRLDWEPTECGELVLGYNIYRQAGGGGLNQDTVCCQQSPADLGLELIGSTEGWLSTDFTDSLLNIEGILGKEICYAVTALYGEPTQPTVPVLESCAAEACLELRNEEIFLYNDSIASTDALNGSTFLSWSQPDIDSIFPAPYEYRLYRANNNGFPAIEIGRFAYGDTTFLDEGLNTEIRAYNHRVEIFDSFGLRIKSSDNTNIGSSIFLTATGGGNNYIDLTWEEYVPWNNQNYEIHRSEAGGPFDFITLVPGTGASFHAYRDENLNPEVRYCYFIRSVGTYGLPDLKEPLINDSQVACDFAQDDEPPCPPGIFAEGNCESGIHTLTINKPLLDCAADADSISIYLANNIVGPYRRILSLDYPSFGQDTILRINLAELGLPEAGCYVTTATDTLGNVSSFSPPTCVDYCPGLIMSNIFSPNNDGINDVLTPVFFRDVVLQEIKIFDRWGRLMHTGTTDIGRLWNGLYEGNGQPAKEGTYYYTMRYEELGLNGNETRDLRGWITLLR